MRPAITSRVPNNAQNSVLKAIAAHAVAAMAAVAALVVSRAMAANATARLPLMAAQ